MAEDDIPVPGGDEVGKQISTESSLSNWAGDYVTNMLGKGEALSNQPYEAFTGPLTAGPSELQNDAFGGIAGLTLPEDYGTVSEYGKDIYQNAGEAGQYDPLATNPNTFNPMTTNPAAGYDPYQNQYADYQAQTSTAGDYQNGDIGTEMWNNQYAEQYMNPFVQQALTPQLAEIQRQAEMQRQVEQGQMTQAGAYGGSRSALLNSEMDDNMLRLMAELTGKGYQNAYQSAGNLFTSDYARDLEAQKANEQSRQYGATLGLEADKLNQADRQFGANLGLQGDQLAEQSSQFGANLGFQGDKLMEQSSQYGAGLDMEGSRLMEQSNQFGAGLGLDALQKQLSAAGLLNTNANSALNAERDIYGDQLDAGAIQRGITSEGINADRAQFEQERDYPYQQVQYMHSLLGGMPLATQNYDYGQASTWSDMLSGGGQFQELFDIFNPSGGTPPTTTDGTNSGNTGTTGTDPDNLGG
jgi:hypothetical protein